VIKENLLKEVEDQKTEERNRQAGRHASMECVDVEQRLIVVVRRSIYIHPWG
jgi:hypothetical protein